MGLATDPAWGRCCRDKKDEWVEGAGTRALLVRKGTWAENVSK